MSGFEVHKDRAIAVLQLAAHAESQLKLLLERLARWVRDNAAMIDTAYVTLRDAKLAFLVVSKTPECNDDLEDSISELDFHIANDPDLEPPGGPAQGACRPWGCRPLRAFRGHP